MPEIEAELIDLATAETRGRLLNVMDVPWWMQPPLTGEGPPVYLPQSESLVIEDVSKLAESCSRMRRAGVIGLDVETTLSRQLCLIQVATPTVNYLVDPLLVRDREPLHRLLAEGEVEKVVHNAAFERSVFRADGVELRRVYDTLTASRNRHGHRVDGGHGLAAVCERELGFTLDKRVQCSDWRRRPLSEEQQKYAAADAEVLLMLARRFKARDRLLFPS